MEQLVQQLIAAGRLEDALEVLVKNNVDGAIQLKGQFATAKREQIRGTMTFSDWGIIQNRITYSALELVKSATNAIDLTAATSNASASNAPAANGTPKTVFISYNHGDKDTARRIHDYLKARNYRVILDVEQMEAGGSIVDFIKQSIKNSQYVVSIVSERSLQSGWVGKESVAASFASWLTDQSSVVVSLDNKFTDTGFYITALRSIKEKLTQKEAEIAEIRELDGDPTPVETEKKRLFDLQKNLGDILDRLRETLVVDVSGDQFEAGMAKVVARLR
jgi:hypothetical protein